MSFESCLDQFEPVGLFVLEHYLVRRAQMREEAWSSPCAPPSGLEDLTFDDETRMFEESWERCNILWKLVWPEERLRFVGLSSYVKVMADQARTSGCRLTATLGPVDRKLAFNMEPLLRGVMAPPPEVVSIYEPPMPPPPLPVTVVATSGMAAGYAEGCAVAAGGDRPDSAVEPLMDVRHLQEHVQDVPEIDDDMPLLPLPEELRFEGLKQKKRRKKKQQKADSDQKKVKRWRTGYMMFMVTEAGRVRKDSAAAESDQGAPSSSSAASSPNCSIGPPGALAKKMGRIWATMTHAQREPYMIMAREDKLRYDQEVQGIVVSLEKSSTKAAAHPEVPQHGDLPADPDDNCADGVDVGLVENEWPSVGLLQSVPSGEAEPGQGPEDASVEAEESGQDADTTTAVAVVASSSPFFYRQLDI